LGFTARGAATGAGVVARSSVGAIAKGLVINIMLAMFSGDGGRGSGTAVVTRIRKPGAAIGEGAGFGIFGGAVETRVGESAAAGRVDFATSCTTGTSGGEGSMIA
jgi:hypothetical protein